MSTLLDPPSLASETDTTSAATRLRQTMAAARLSFTWLGVRKALTTAQKTVAADSFGAEGRFLSAGKKLLDTTHPAMRAVTAVRGQAIQYFRSVSLPFPEPGIRLIRQEKLTAFSDQLAIFREQLDSAVAELDRHYDELRSAAQARLGDLFDAHDYPPSVIGLFALEHDFPSVEPPPYLAELSPAHYRQECERIAARFDEAVRLAEQAFLDELAKLVEHLTERLTGEADGRTKVFRDSAVENLTAFFDRFRRLNIRSNPQLDALVDQARAIVGGVHPQDLRDRANLRHTIAAELGSVQASLDALLVERPRRAILRRPR